MVLQATDMVVVAMEATEMVVVVVEVKGVSLKHMMCGLQMTPVSKRHSSGSMFFRISQSLCTLRWYCNMLCSSSQQAQLSGCQHCNRLAQCRGVDQQSAQHIVMVMAVKMAGGVKVVVKM